MPRSVTRLSAYLPLLRVNRRAMSGALGWMGQSLPRAGHRALAGWDEDCVTMATEAARAFAREAPATLRFASTSAYFTDRLQAGIILDALNLPRTVRSMDAANSRRAGTTALLDALLVDEDAIVIAAEKRPTNPGSASQLAYGDGAAAVRTGEGDGARLAASASLSHDLVDRYTSRERPEPYGYEERFVREIAVREILLPTIAAACSKASIDPSAIAHVAVAEPVSGCWAAIARKLAIAAPNHCETLNREAGDLGAAHPLFGLGLALAAAEIGEWVLMAGFGSGADVLLFEKIGEVEGAAELARQLAEGQALENVTRFLSLAGSLDLDWGMRSEFEQKAQAAVLERVGRDLVGFVGGRDSRGGVQFPKSAIPVNPELHRPEQMQDVRLADLEADLVSVTADRLNHTPDPPFDFGLVQFDNGARVLMELTDRPVDGFKVGDRLRMRPRIKSLNRRLGFRTYFWKAAPVARSALDAA